MAVKRMGLLSSPRNRAVTRIDNPCDSDGFYSYVSGHPHKRGKRLWRRAMRRNENARWFADELIAYGPLTD